MHIAVNALLVHGAFSGVQHAILHQLRGLLSLQDEHRYSIITASDIDIAAHLPTGRPYDVIRAPFPGSQKLSRILWEQFRMPTILKNAGVDLLYSPGYLTSLRWHGASVVFVHDTIALSHPQLCSRGNALNYRLLLPPSARHATLVAVPSHASARDVERFCHVPMERIRVVPLGVNIPPTPSETEMKAARQRLGVAGPYLLAVSTIEPKKNFANLIRWFSAWKQAGLPHQLVIVGKWGWGYGDVQRVLAQSPCREDILFPGYLPQQELPAAMAAADLLLIPSLYEGFGLPALEGMAAGAPVVASDQGALPETVGDGGIIIPLEDQRWIEEIPPLLQSPDRLNTLRQAGKARAITQTWQKTAQNLLATLEEAQQLAKSS